MSFADHFDRVYLINLPSRRDRLRRALRELGEQGVSLSPGKVEVFPAVRPDSADGFESVGRRGVFLSHATIARRALEEGLGNVLVLEDDVAFTPAMRTHGEALLRDLHERRWHVAFLGYLTIDAPPQKLAELRAGPPAWLPRPGPKIGSHCYALHGEVLPALVEYMKGVETRPPGHPDGARFGPDATFNMFCSMFPEWTTLVARPNLATQASSASDLAPRWFDQVPGLRQIAGYARQMRAR
jgi:hypothetical protein